jgi:carbon-monoxide dehydrogenase small subunit
VSRREIGFTLNGRPVTVAVDPDQKLARLLRGLGCPGVRIGCDEGVCGACTVILDGRTVNSCHTYAFQAAGRTIETIEAIGTFDQPHRLQTALADEGAVQCGFCTPGLVLSAKALLDREPAPDDELLKRHLDGHLCRCTGYEKIWTAIRRVSAPEIADHETRIPDDRSGSQGTGR